jgi:hypothetical protein
MTVTSIDLYNILRSKIVESEAKSLIEFVEQKVTQTLEENKDRIATKEDIHLLELKIEKVRSDMIKWMFVFWAGQTGLLIGLIKFLL